MCVYHASLEIKFIFFLFINCGRNQQKSKNIVADVGDPNCQCCSCETKLASKKSFKNHLIAVRALLQSAPKKTSLEPDTDDSNNNCRACQRNYSPRGEYRKHLHHMHQIALPSSKEKINSGKLPGPNDPCCRCSLCKRSWTTRAKYRLHCKNAHFMLLGRNYISNPNAIIDINHLGFYRAQCEHSYSGKEHFKMHLGRVHNI